MFTRILSLLFCLLLIPAAQAKEPEKTLDLALIIGNNQHLEDGDWDLHFADDDALETANQFALLYPQGQAWLLVDPDEETLKKHPHLSAGDWRAPTLENWEETLKEIHSVIWEVRGFEDVKIRLFLHFSGHGEKGGSLHLADTLLPPEAFRRGLARLNVDEVFALMDGCHLAQVIRSGSQEIELEPPPIFAEEDIAVQKHPHWLGLIGATTAVPEHDYLARGLLTMVGMSGLLGPADFDGDDLITFFEWSRYISTQVNKGASGPELYMVPPNQDWQSTVVNLKASHSPGVRLEARFPKGQIRIIEHASRRLVADFIHLGDRPISIRMPKGQYDVIHLADRYLWRNGTYPAQSITVTVDTGLVALDESTPSESIVMVPENLRGPSKVNPQAKTIQISAWEARSIINSPAESDLPDISQGLPPLLALSAHGYFPNFGPYLGVQPQGGLQMGGAIKAERLWHMGSRGRLGFAVGPLLQYGLWQASDLYITGSESLTSGLRHELRLGVAGDTTWNRGPLNLSLHPYLAYAPGLITADGGLLRDSGNENEGRWRYTYGRNLALGTDISLRTPLFDKWQVGPSLRLETLRFQLSPQAVTDQSAVVNWVFQASLGLEFRKNIFAQL